MYINDLIYTFMYIRSYVATWLESMGNSKYRALCVVMVRCIHLQLIVNQEQ